MSTSSRSTSLEGQPPEEVNHVASYLELLQMPYTGCNPRGLMIARDKALSKKIATCHRVRVPRFATFPRGRKVRRPAGLAFPLFVKSLTEEASLGIAQASLVTSDEKLEERGIFQRQAQDLPEGIEAKLRRVCRRIMRMLELDGYARLDFRLREDGELFFLEMPRGLLSGNFPRG